MTEAVFPGYDPTVLNAIRDGATRFGDRDFVVTPTDRLTYRDLDEQSRRLAIRLVHDGVRKGDRVAVMFANGVEWVTAFAAVTRIGAVIVPVSTFYRGAELVRFLRHAEIGYLLGAPRILGTDFAVELARSVPGLEHQDANRLVLPTLPQLRRVLFWDPCEVRWAMPDYAASVADSPAELGAVVEALEHDVSPADPLMVMYTSGSTAEPKGVVHTHGAVVRHASNMAAWAGWNSSFRVWSSLPLFWIGGFHSVMFRCLMAGGTYLTQPGFRAADALAFAAGERATHLIAWPTSAVALRQVPGYDDLDLSTVLGGVLYERRPIDRRPPDPGLVSSSLGMTETCGPYCAAPEEHEIHGVPEEYRGAYGRRVPGIEVEVVDPVSGEVLAEGEEGEIVVRGYSLMTGLQRHERSEVFDADGWYHTADHGYFRDGWLFFTGRGSDMIKTSGANVAASEVEGALVSHPAIDQAFVFGLPDGERGEDVVALLIADGHGDSRRPTGAEIVAWLRNELSSYKVPRRIHFISDDDIALMPSQKIDRQALRALAERMDADAL